MLSKYQKPRKCSGLPSIGRDIDKYSQFASNSEIMHLFHHSKISPIFGMSVKLLNGATN